MDINGFLGELLREISHVDFVGSIDFHIEVITIKGRVLLRKEPFTHKSISEKSISEIIRELQKIYLQLQD